MKVLSLFDGISCGRVALERAGIEIEKYYASEIDDYAMAITQFNYPDTIQLGDITQLTEKQLDNLGDIDIVIGGSPCQDLSNYKYDRGEVTGLNGEKSGLFYHYVRVLKHVKPKYFLLENVASMENKWKDMISEILGVQPMMINSALVCAAERKRYYWMNWNVEQPNDKGILLKDIVFESSDVPEKYYYTKYPLVIHEGDVKVKATIELNGHRQAKEVYGLNHKCNTLLCDGNGGNLVKKIYQDGRCRKLMPIEYERLQTLPDNYTAKGKMGDKEVNISDSRRYSAIGNGWTVDVIAHLFKSLFEALESDENAEIIEQPKLFETDKEEVKEMEETKLNTDMIQWDELDDLIGKPVFDKDNDEWRILKGYQRMGNYYSLTFTDSNGDFEDVDLNCTNLFLNEEFAYQK